LTDEAVKKGHARTSVSSYAEPQSEGANGKSDSDADNLSGLIMKNIGMRWRKTSPEEEPEREPEAEPKALSPAVTTAVAVTATSAATTSGDISSVDDKAGERYAADDVQEIV
jgi:hypothetical protein